MRYTHEQIAEQRKQCADLQRFIRNKARLTGNLRSATTYAEIAAVIDCYMEAIEATATPVDLSALQAENTRLVLENRTLARQLADYQQIAKEFDAYIVRLRQIAAGGPPL